MTPKRDPRVAVMRPFIVAAMKGGGSVDDCIVAALKAADAAGWQMIETAPTDGSDVLVLGRPIPGERGAVWIDCYEVIQEGGEEGWPISVTHWRPLPSAPGDEG